MDRPHDSGRVDLKRFFIIYPLLCLLSLGVFGTLPSEYFLPVCKYTAKSTGWALDVLNVDNVIFDDRMIVHGTHIKIIAECTGVFISILFIAFIAVYPTRLKNKLLGLLLGIPTLFTANMLRLIVLFYMDKYHGRYVGYAHTILGQVFMVTIGFLCVLIWIDLFVNKKDRQGIYIFIAKIVGFGSLLSMPWVLLHKFYVSLNAEITHYLLLLIGHDMRMPIIQEVYPNTFNVIVFGALIISTSRLSVKARFNCFLAGFAILMAADIVLMFFNALHYGLGVKYIKVFITTIQLFNQKFLPIALWGFLIYRSRTHLAKNSLITAITL
jgi:exosortase/archaeosortase family protein